MALQKPIGIFTADQEFIIRSWDSWLEAATGIRPSSAVGQALHDVIPDFVSRGFDEPFRRALEEGVIEILTPHFHQYLIPCPPSRLSRRFERMQQKVTIAPLREDTKTIGLIVTVEDVTAQLDEERDEELIDILDRDNWAARRQATSKMTTE